MTPDEIRPGAPTGDEPRDAVADFFAVERDDIRDLGGDDARWIEITREAGRPRRTGWLRYAAVAAAVVLIGGSVWAVSANRVGRPVAAGQPAVTRTVDVSQSPAPSSAPSRSSAPSTTAPATTSPPTAPATAVTAVPAGFAVASVSTVSNGRLFALGRATCAAGPCAMVATSSDGGVTWSLRGQLPGVSVDSRGSASGALTRSPDTVSDVRFASDSIGWAFGAQVLRTSDGGRTWTPYAHGGGAAVLDVETDGTDVVLATAAACAGDACSGPVSVIRAPATASSASAAGDLGGTLDTGPGVTAADIGWSAGKAVITVIGGTGLPAQLLLTDGLHPVAVTGCTGTGAIRLIIPAAGTTLYALCQPDSGAGHLGFGVVASAGGGATWTPVTPTGPVVANAGGVSVTASDASHLLVVSGGRADLHGSMTVSSDGGRTWHEPASPPSPPDRGWAWVGSPGARTFYAVPTDPVSGFWRSTDGGETWSRVTVAH